MISFRLMLTVVTIMTLEYVTSIQYSQTSILRTRLYQLTHSAPEPHPLKNLLGSARIT